MYELSHHLSEALRQDLQEKLEQYEREVPVRLFIDGQEIELEETLDYTSEIDRSGGEIHIHRNFGLRDILMRHPDEYIEELHWDLFNKKGV